jgi:hypothetical protein
MGAVRKRKVDEEGRKVNGGGGVKREGVSRFLLMIRLHIVNR